MTRARLALALAALVLATGAHAQWNEPDRWEAPEAGEPRARDGVYAELRGGAFLPTAGELDDLGLNAGYGADATVGYAIGRWFALELGSGWFEASGDPLAGGAALDGRFTLRMVPVTAGARVFLAQGAFRPYLGAGFGIYLLELGAKGTIGSTRLSGSDRTWAKGLQAGGGFRAQLGRRVSLVLDARYRATGADFGVGGLGDLVRLEASDVDVTGVSVTGGLAFDL
jgi:opacity protein-like surface antigen